MIMNLFKDYKYFSIYHYISKSNILEDSVTLHHFKFPKLLISICGDTFSSPAIITLENIGWDGFVIDRESFHGESGTIFYDQIGNLYVLSRTTVLQFYDYKKRYTILQSVGTSVKTIGKDKIMILPWR